MKNIPISAISACSYQHLISHGPSCPCFAPYGMAKIVGRMEALSSEVLARCIGATLLVADIYAGATTIFIGPLREHPQLYAGRPILGFFWPCVRCWVDQAISRFVDLIHVDPSLTFACRLSSWPTTVTRS